MRHNQRLDSMPPRQPSPPAASPAPRRRVQAGDFRPPRGAGSAWLGLLVLLQLTLGGLAPTQALAGDRSLYRVPPLKAEALRQFLRLGLDIAGTGSDGSLHVLLDASGLAAVEAIGIVPEPLASRGPNAAPGAVQAPPGLGNYHTYAEAVAEMSSYVAAHPAIARLDTIGVSLEGRLILGVKISDNVGIDEPEPEVLIVGCHHARELMSVELPLYGMRRLLDGYGSDPILTSLVDTRQIWIVPIVNPDGYVYVQNNSGGQPDNWWRKNRRLNSDGSYGVDLNRNYGFNWGFDDLGSSPTPSSDVYRGAGPFSEPETAAIRDFMAAHSFRVSASFHSYGDLFLYPWGFAAIDTPDNPVFAAFGDSVSLQNGYRSGNPKNNAIYITNGDMDDWVYGDTSLKPRLFGFTFELNTYAEGGFYPSDTLIPATCALNWGPVLTLLRYADEPHRILPPARTSPPTYVVQNGSLAMQWTVPVPDAANPPARHEIRGIGTVGRVLDDAEGGVSDWDSLRFAWSTARHASGSHSYYSGAGNGRESILTGRATLDVAGGDSVVVSAFWDLENFYDYWYAEASVDGGATWQALQGDRTTVDNPFGYNQGSGITGTSGGVFLRAAFSLAPFAGKQVTVRFRCLTDGAVFGEGLYLDDVAPTARYADVTLTDTGSSATNYLLTPAPSSQVSYQVRAIDAEGQRGRWGDRATFSPGVTGIGATAVARADDRLWPNAPNPFNPRTRLRFRIAAGEPGRYRLAVYGVSGRLVSVVDSGKDQGLGLDKSVDWSGRDAGGRDLPSGVYLLRLETPRGFTERKITLLR